MADPMPLPFRPRDWVASVGDHTKIARVRDCYRESVSGAVLLDLAIHDTSGRRLGRTSPALGGPRTYEPACDATGWERIPAPEFPVHLKWIDLPDGTRAARYVAGEILPPADWVPKPRKARATSDADDPYRAALQAIADGHNDPRALAKAVLGLT